MFYEIISHYTGSLNEFTPWPDISDRTAWQELPRQSKKTILADADKLKDWSFPALFASSYMAFSRTGNRDDYEQLYFQKRINLNRLILAECIQHDGRYLDAIIDGIFSICEESGWQLPAHNSLLRDHPVEPLPDPAAPVVDLFACETAALLSTAWYLLKDSLQVISPLIGRRIHHEISVRVLLPYLNSHFWWMGDGVSMLNNWTTWCTQNILLTAFLSDQSEELRCRVAEQACRSLDDFLKDYGEDGCCSEGAHYYRRAGLCLFQCIEILNAVTNNTFSSLYAEPKIWNIAHYIYYVNINDDFYVNFADCPARAGYAGASEYRFGQRLGSKALQAFAARQWQTNTDPLGRDEQNLYDRLQTLFTAAELTEAGKSASVSSAAAPRPNDIYYASNGLLCASDSTWFLAAKCGDNNDSHNHNDTGSFIIYRDGIPFFIDIGVETYTKKTFSPDRYDIWTMQSSYHNLPDIGPYQQQAGSQYRASGIRYVSAPDQVSLSFDLAQTYPADCGLDYYRRSIHFVKNDSITITDTYAFSAEPLPVIWNLICSEKPELRDNRLYIGSVPVSCSTLAQIRIETIEITDPRLLSSWDSPLYRIRIPVPAGGIKLHMSEGK